MSKTDPKKGVGELEILFPYAEVKRPDGTAIQVRPLTLEDLPKVLEAFNNLALLVDKETSPTVLAITGMKELIEIMPYCVDCERKEVPASLLPDILAIMVKQNLAQDTLGKWQALIQQFSALAVGGKAPVSQSKQTSGS